MVKTTYISLIEQISQDTNLSKKTVREVMDTFIKAVKNLENEGDTIYLKNLGKFTVKKRAQRVMKLNKDGNGRKEEVIPERLAITFKRTGC